MLDIPKEVHELFKQDSISKNFRVHFVNGEYRDLVNKDMVAESVEFTESSMSQNTLKLGICESGVITFQTYFTENIRDLDIFCCIEIDITSLGEDFISQYGQTSSDVDYPFYTLPYGYFTVDAVTRTGKTGIFKVVAYNDKQSNTKISKFFSLPNMFKELLRWGASRRYFPSTPFVDDTPPRLTLNFNNLVDSIVPESSVVTRTILDSYNSSSSVFVRNKYEYSAFVNGNYSSITDKQFHNFCNPVGKSVGIWIQRAVDEVTYRVPVQARIHARGKMISIFPIDSNDTYTYEPIFNNNNLNVDVYNTKAWSELNYALKFIENGKKVNYALSWENSITMSDIQNSMYPIRELLNEIGGWYDELKSTYDEEEIHWDTFTGAVQKNLRLLEWLISPCIKFCDTTYINSKLAGDGSVSFYTDTFPGIAQTVYDSRVASYTIDEQTTRYDVHGSIQGYNYARLSAKNRILNISPENVNNRYELVAYHDFVQGLDEGEDAESKYWRKEYKSTDPSNYSWTRNYLTIFVPTELVITFTKKEYAYYNYLHPGEYTEYSYVDENKFDSFVIPVNEFASPRLDKFMIETNNETLDDAVLSLDTKLLSYNEYTNVINVIDHEEIHEGESLDMVKILRHIYAADTKSIDALISHNTLRSIVSSWAELQGKYIRYSRTSPNMLELVSPSTGILLPADTLYPHFDLYPSGPTFLFERSDWYKLSYDTVRANLLDSIIANCAYWSIDSNGNYISQQQEVTLPLSNNYSKLYDTIRQIYNITDNYILNNRFVEYSITEADTISDIQGILSSLMDILKNIVYYKVNMIVRAQPDLETIDYVSVVSNDFGAVLYVNRHTIKGIQCLTDTIDSN